MYMLLLQERQIMCNRKLKAFNYIEIIVIESEMYEILRSQMLERGEREDF
jgi:hypothetical protein